MSAVTALPLRLCHVQAAGAHGSLVTRVFAHASAEARAVFRRQGRTALGQLQRDWRGFSQGVETVLTEAQAAEPAPEEVGAHGKPH